MCSFLWSSFFCRATSLFFIFLDSSHSVRVRETLLPKIIASNVNQLGAGAGGGSEGAGSTFSVSAPSFFSSSFFSSATTAGTIAGIVLSTSGLQNSGSRRCEGQMKNQSNTPLVRTEEEARKHRSHNRVKIAIRE